MMTVEYLPLWCQAWSHITAPDRNGWTIVYGEHEVLTHIDGYMIIYGQRCRIILRASLTDGQKQTALYALLRRLPQVIQPARQIILWSVDYATPTAQDI